jgi:hypothetical protein
MIDFIQLMYALLGIAMLFFISGMGINFGYLGNKTKVVPYEPVEDFRDIFKVPSLQECKDLGYPAEDYGKCVSAAVPRLPDLQMQAFPPMNSEPVPYSE